MDNINKMNADRLRNAEDVLAGMRVQGPVLAAELIALLFAGAPPRKVTIAEMVELFADALERASTKLRTADAAHIAETSSDVDARTHRDAALAALRDAAGSAAHSITGAYGDATTVSMGLDVVWATRPDLLIAQIRNALSLMRKPRPRTAARAGVTIDIAALASSLESRCAALETALDEVKREERAAQMTYQARETVLAEWERAYPGIAEVFTGLCIMTGRMELAARVKPTVRKTRGEVAPVSEPPVVTPVVEDVVRDVDAAQ